MENRGIFKKGAYPNEMPDGPITQEWLDNLRPCDLVNPKLPNDYGFKTPDDFDPIESTAEILLLRQKTLRGEFDWDFMEKYWPFNFKMPRKFSKALELAGVREEYPIGCAVAVHMDDPLDLFLFKKKVLTNPKYGGKYNIKGRHGRFKQFLETVVKLNKTVADLQWEFMNKIFEVKSALRLERPEEVTPELGTYITQYEEGCPCHGSNGGGHTTASFCGSRALNTDLKLSPAAQMESLFEDWIFGQFRCMAGMHHGIDGIISVFLVLQGTELYDLYVDKEKAAKYYK